MTGVNPFVDVYNALWNLAEDSTPLTTLVKPSNRIKYNQSVPYDPTKDEVSEADLPELLLVSTGSSGNLRQSSSTSSIIRQYEWLIATGDTSLVNKLLRVEWALFCAMSDWPTVLNALTFQGSTFCKRTQLVSVNSGLTDPERNRGINGWSSIWALEVEMHFKTTDLHAVNIGTGSA